MLFKDKLHDIIETIENQKLLLAPVEFGWAICFDPFLYNIHVQMSNFSNILDDSLFVMVRDIPMMKKIYPKLHPRLETLLVHHRRPLGVVYPHEFGKSKSLKTAICLSFDPYIRHIIDLLDHPIACVFLKRNEILIEDFDIIHSSIIDSVDYIAKHRRDESLGGIKPILVTNDDEGNLIFP